MHNTADQIRSSCPSAATRVTQPNNLPACNESQFVPPRPEPSGEPGRKTRDHPAQREVVQRYLVATLSVEGPLGWLAEFEATLSELRSMRAHLSAQFAALTTTRRLIESFWSLPVKRRCELATN